MRLVKQRERGRPEFNAVKGLKGKKRSAFILLSGRVCNTSCPHCLTVSGENRTELAKPGTARRIIENIKPTLKTGNVYFVSLSGGEPMLNLDFMGAVIEELKRACSETKVPLPKFVVATNGTVSGKEITKVLEPIKSRVSICYSQDGFHPPPSAVRFFELHRFHVFDRNPEPKMIALGNGFGMEGDFDWKIDCDVEGVKYNIVNDSIVVLNRNVSTSKFMVRENGDMNLCGCGGLVFGNLAKETTFNIADKLKNDEKARALMEKGPLGLAEVMGKLKEAVEIYLKKGSCAVCHALKEKII